MIDRLFNRVVDTAIEVAVGALVWRRKLLETRNRFFELVRTLDQRGR